MALTSKERKELKDAGYMYHRQSGQWMLPEEIERYEAEQEQSEQFAVFIMGIPAVGLLIWLFLLAIGVADNPYG